MDASVVALQAALTDAEARHRTLSTQLGRVNKVSVAKGTLRTSVIACEHSTADLHEAVAAALAAVAEQRRSYEVLQGTVGIEESGTGKDRGGKVQRGNSERAEVAEVGTLREAGAEAKRRLRKAEEALRETRSCMAAASHVIQQAVVASNSSKPSR